MSQTPTPRHPRSAAAAFATTALFALGAIAAALAAALGAPGPARGLLLGVALLCIALGGAFAALAVARARRRPGEDWLPSRDDEAPR